MLLSDSIFGGIYMFIIIWLAAGGVIGWLASLIMRRDAQQGAMLNVVVGIVGALLAGWLIAPSFGVATINEGNFRLGGMLVSLLGAIVLLALVNLFHRDQAR